MRPRRQPLVCTVDGCERAAESRDMCAMHSRRHRLGLDLHAPHFRERGRVRAADLIDLTDAGVSAAEALARVGWTAEAAMRWAWRHGRDDVAAVVRPEYNASHRVTKQRRAA